MTSINACEYYVLNRCQLFFFILAALADFFVILFLQLESGAVMQISEKSIQDTIAFIVAACRRGSAECHTDFMVDDYYWHSRSKLEG
ncbi:MAG: hypothetical protein ACXV8U_09865, partial [Methylobacter sp.]